MSDTMPWTVAMMEVVADGQWHDREDVLAVAMAVIPEDRALEEIGERSLTMSPEKRARAGARTVALQALQGRRRFGAVEIKDIDGVKMVRKTGHDGASVGHVAERVDRLLDEVASLRALVSQLVAYVGFEEPVPGGGSKTEELVSATELLYMLDNKE